MQPFWQTFHTQKALDCKENVIFAVLLLKLYSTKSTRLESPTARNKNVIQLLYVPHSF